jgi:hypothetical protein
VTIITAASTGDVDVDGVPITQAPIETPWVGVNVQQLNTDEDLSARRNLTVSTFRVSGPIPAVIPTSADRIRRGGIEYSIVGEPDTRRGRHRINHTSLIITDARG